MSEPTLLTTLTAQNVGTSSEAPGFLSSFMSKAPQLLWLLVIGLVIIVIFLYMARRADRILLERTRNNQMHFVRTKDCVDMISESIHAYDLQRQQAFSDARITTERTYPLPEESEDEESEESEDENDDSEDENDDSEDENDENDDEEEMSVEDDDTYDQAMETPVASHPPPPTPREYAPNM